MLKEFQDGYEQEDCEEGRAREEGSTCEEVDEEGAEGQEVVLDHQ